ncbi:MAG: methionine--tRNA ligase [Candidatus Liptonbacteria bacterium]|nr:methionine--tRNA ligase [Candidatus Liptonbacteria bacterium]
MDRKFYITTTLPYVNAEPHIGFAMEIVHADIIARYRRILGDDVFFNTGTDEHGLKIYRKAIDSKKDPQAYADEYAEKFRKLKGALNLSDDLHFIRTTDPHHKQAAQEFWKLCEKNGDIYKDTYKTKYCVGCELEKTDSELVDGKCPIHPNLELEIIEEENYFFRFSKYQKPLLELYEKNPEFVLPESRLNEIKRFVEARLTDFSISRLKEKMPWGVPVPGDEKHVMYVWFDALINYISTLGWPEDTKNFEEFWGTKDAPNGIQMAGKDQVRQQAAMWQAMLMSANLPNSKQILIHGFVTSNGQKMSKSLGNVIDPYEVVEKYGTDAFRYYIARELNTFDDSDFTWEKFKERYNADLANGLGNLVSRIMKMAAANKVRYDKGKASERIKTLVKIDQYKANFSEYNLQAVISFVWGHIELADKYIQYTEPFKKIKENPEGAKEDINSLLFDLDRIAIMLKPFMPETSEKIFEAIKTNSEIKTPLFPRK